MYRYMFLCIIVYIYLMNKIIFFEYSIMCTYNLVIHRVCCQDIYVFICVCMYVSSYIVAYICFCINKHKSIPTYY